MSVSRLKMSHTERASAGGSGCRSPYVTQSRNVCHTSTSDEQSTDPICLPAVRAHLARADGALPAVRRWDSMVEEIIAPAPAAPGERRSERRAGRPFAASRLDEIEGDGEERLHAADRRVCPRAGRRHCARLDCPGRRRPGHRQIDPDAAGDAGNGRAGTRALRFRRGIGAPDQDARAAPAAR